MRAGILAFLTYIVVAGGAVAIGVPRTAAGVIGVIAALYVAVRVHRTDRAERALGHHAQNQPQVHPPAGSELPSPAPATPPRPATHQFPTDPTEVAAELWQARDRAGQDHAELSISDLVADTRRAHDAGDYATAFIVSGLAATPVADTVQTGDQRRLWRSGFLPLGFAAHGNALGELMHVIGDAESHPSAVQLLFETSRPLVEATADALERSESDPWTPKRSTSSVSRSVRPSTLNSSETNSGSPLPRTRHVRGCSAQ
ncbi:MAG: hypothetical protein AAFZ07_23370 [Actinomycetota bacterium]